MKKKISKITIKMSVFALLLLPLSENLSSELSYAETIQQNSTSIQIDKEADTIEKEISPFFNLIEKMPESIANQGIDAGVKWLNDNKTKEFSEYKFVNQDGSLILQPLSPFVNGNTIKRFNWAGCISAVGVAVATNAIPWAKILKVKKAAKAVGGMTKMTKMIITAYKHQRNLGRGRIEAIKKAVEISAKSFPKDTRQALIEFFSLGGLSACFT